MKQSLPLENYDLGQDGPRKGSWYRLTIMGGGPEVVFEFDTSGARIGILPLVGEKTEYLLKLNQAAERVQIVGPPEGASATPAAFMRHARPRDFAALATQILRAPSAKKIRFTGNDFAFLLNGSDRMNRADLAALTRRYRKKNRDQQLILQLQLSDQQCAKFYPNIDDDWSCPDLPMPATPVPSGAPIDVAIYIHLFHAESWPDFCVALKKINFLFDLHISMPETRPRLEAEISARYPLVHFHTIENRGRDIWPFVDLLQSGVFKPYAAVCKLHSKKSTHLHRAYTNFDIGQRWCRSAILELIGTPGRADQILGRFRASNSIGIVGPSNLRIALSSVGPRDKDWGASKNWPKMKKIAGRLNIPERDLRIDFFAGSMFWFAPRAMNGIAGGDISASEFEPEPIAGDGTLPHAMERMFNLIATNAGFEVLGSRNV